MRFLIGLLVVLLVGAIVLQSAAIGGAWWLHRQQRYADEIRWLEGFRPILVWERGLDAQIDRLYSERVRRELDAGRLGRAVYALRKARARSGPARHDHELMALGIETYTRVADQLESQGRLAHAADWDDSLFVLAIRAPEPHHRYAALAAFVEGLDLRVRDGHPCAAVARVEWARQGLGGTVPGLQASIEEDLAQQCAQERRRRSR